MARPPRIHYPGAIYHTMARGVDGREIYHDDRDRHRFLRQLDKVSRDCSAEILAYCLMGNHFHLAIRIGRIPLYRVIHRILTAYSLSFNHRHGRQGHLFQARYKAVLCRNDRYLTALIRYIHSNPVKANLAASVLDWDWSSARSFAAAGKTALLEYIDELPELESIDDIRPAPATRGPDKTSAQRIDLDALASTIDGPTSTELRSPSRRRELTMPRGQLVKAAIREGYSLGEIARWLGRSPTAIRHYIDQ